MFTSYHTTRTRERSPLYSDHDNDDYYSTRRLVRTNSKRAYNNSDDDEYDDYPYTTNSHKHKPSRALTIRQPSQLEKYNVWSRPASSSPKHSHAYSAEKKYYRGFDDEEDNDRTVRYKYTTTRYSPSPAPAPEDTEDREFRLKVKATFGRPKSSSSSARPAMAWAGDMFRRREKWVDEDWEQRERRRDSVFDDEEEKSVRFRRVKRTKTEEWRPLGGFRR